MRTFRSIAVSVAVILACLAGVLGLSISSALREHERLMDEFAGTTRQQVHASALARDRSSRSASMRVSRAPRAPGR